MTKLTTQLRAVRASIPTKSLKTARAIDWQDVLIAIRKAAEAKKRVRVYSDDGFVPNSYKWRCQIQYVEVQKTEEGLRVFTGWTGAQRPNGSGSLVLVQ